MLLYWSLFLFLSIFFIESSKPYILYLDNMNVFSINLNGTDQQMLYDMTVYKNQLIGQWLMVLLLLF